jgi:hypothetical protein
MDFLEHNRKLYVRKRKIVNILKEKFYAQNGEKSRGMKNIACIMIKKPVIIYVFDIQ